MKLPSQETLKKTLGSVPDESVSRTYISRTLVGGHSDYDIFDYAMQRQLNVLLEGPSGSGKTTAVMAYAALRQYPFYSVSSSVGLEPSQLFGKYVPDEHDVGFVWIDGPVTQLVRYGGLLLLNELNFMPDRVGTVLFSLLDNRREIQLVDHKGEVIRAHKELLIVADMNPDYEGTRPLNKALRNRFRIQLHWDYDSDVESQLVHMESLRSMANMIRNEAAKGTYETPVSTNMLMEFERISLDLGIGFAVTNFVTHFAVDERPSVKLVCDTYLANLESDLSILIAQQIEKSELDEDNDPLGLTPEERARLRDQYEDKLSEHGGSMWSEDEELFKAHWIYADEGTVN